MTKPEGILRGLLDERAELLALAKEASEIMTITYAGNFPAGIEGFLVRAAAAIAKVEGASRYCTCEANGIEIPSRHAEDCRYRTMPRYIQENKYGRAENAKAEGK